MLARRLIPCLDVRAGQVVKGIRFQDHRVMGEIVELAVRNVVHGRPVNNMDALANPEALRLYEALAELQS